MVFPHAGEHEPVEFWYHMLKNGENALLVGKFPLEIFDTCSPVLIHAYLQSHDAHDFSSFIPFLWL